MKNRIIALLICTVMLVGMLPITSLALTQLREVGIAELTAPAAGAMPDYSVQHDSSVYLSAGNNNPSYYKNGICWYDMTTSSIIKTNSVFVTGHQYKAVLYLMVEDGFTFAPNVRVTVDNMTVTESDRFNDECITVDIIFDAVPTPEPIVSVSYTLEGYELGSPINGVTISSDSAVKTDGVYGSDYFITIANRIPIMNGSFEAETVYTLYIAVESDTHDISGLTKNNITLNGKTANNTETVNARMFAIFLLTAFETPTTEIYSILLATDVPDAVAGQSFFYPEIYAANGEEIMKNAVKLSEKGEGFGWYRSDYYVENAYYEYVTDTSCFENGKSYMLFVTIEAEEGYTITSDCFVAISTPNGLMPGQCYYSGSGYVQYTFYCNLGAPEMLPAFENAQIELGGYQKGKPVNEITVIPTINGKKTPYTSVGDMPIYGIWYAIMNGNGDFVAEGSFEYDTDYILALLFPANQYDFTSVDKSDITLNGKSADSVDVEHGMAKIRFKLPRLTKESANPFTDVKSSHWFAASVLYCVEHGYVAGMTDTTFVPNGKLTRAQFLTILAKLDGVDLTQYYASDAGFDDVKTSHWYNEVVCWAVEKGYTSGLSADRFGPNADITRAQLARFFYVYSEKNGVNINGRADISAFPDAGKVAGWARTGIEWAVDAGLISGVAKNGVNYIDPNGNATRAQATVMFKAYDDFRGINN